MGPVPERVRPSSADFYHDELWRTMASAFSNLIFYDNSQKRWLRADYIASDDYLPVRT